MKELIFSKLIANYEVCLGHADQGGYCLKAVKNKGMMRGFVVITGHPASSTATDTFSDLAQAQQCFELLCADFKLAPVRELLKRAHLNGGITHRVHIDKGCLVYSHVAFRQAVEMGREMAVKAAKRKALQRKLRGKAIRADGKSGISSLSSALW